MYILLKIDRDLQILFWIKIYKIIIWIWTFYSNIIISWIREISKSTIFQKQYLKIIIKDFVLVFLKTCLSDLTCLSQLTGLSHLNCLTCLLHIVIFGLSYSSCLSDSSYLSCLLYLYFSSYLSYLSDLFCLLYLSFSYYLSCLLYLSFSFYLTALYYLTGLSNLSYSSNCLSRHGCCNCPFHCTCLTHLTL